MATPLTPDQWLTALKAEGVKYAEHAGWRTAGRDSATGKPFGPVHGVLIHHTGGTSSLSVIVNGRSDLPGPLAHGLLAKSGTVTLTSARRANHAGLAATNAYNALAAESSTHPKPSKTSGTVDGNDVLYGLEIENLGTSGDPYPAAQYDAAVRWAAAICRFHGWSADSVAGHKETSVEGKVDPSFSMDKFRQDVAARLAHPANWSPGGSVPPPKEDDMAELTADQVARLPWTYKGTDETQDAYGYLRTTGATVKTLSSQVQALQTTLAAQSAAITALAGKVGAGADTAAIVTAVQTAISEAVVKVSVDVTGAGA